MAASKPTAVHFALVFFVLLSIVLGLLYYPLFNQRHTELVAEKKKIADELKDVKAGRDKFYEQIELLKQLVGHGFENIGERGTANTVLGAGYADIENAAPEVAEKNYSAVIASLLTDKQNALTERDDLRKKLDEEHDAYLALESKWTAQLDEQKSGRTKSEQDVASLTKTKEEELAAKENDITELKKAITETQVTFDTEKDSWQKKQKELEQRITNLQVMNVRLQDELEEVKRTSFERPDGLVRWVDNLSKTVWINLGEADNLHKRTTFSVYKQTNNGVARGTEDIKGSIEVTRLMGPHMAEARILKEDIYNPMAPGDAIYTPLWSPGGSDQFSFIGSIDLDGDGREDRDMLHETVQIAGAVIDNEVDDQGNRTGTGITERTKFLVLGKLPDLGATNVAEEQEIIKKIYEHLKAMRQEAREHGVRVVPLSDFLAYIGYKSQRRIFRPGEQQPYKLNAGAASPSVGKSLGKRESAGKTADVYSGDRRVKAKTSTGQTSRLMKGGG